MNEIELSKNLRSHQVAQIGATRSEFAQTGLDFLTVFRDALQSDDSNFLKKK